MPIAKWLDGLSFHEQTQIANATTCKRKGCLMTKTEKGLRALWAVGDSCVVVCPVSHKANVQPPPSMARAEGEYPDYEGCSQTIAPRPRARAAPKSASRRPGPIPPPSATAFDA